MGTAAAHGARRGLAARPLRAATHVQGGGGGALTVSAPWRAALPTVDGRWRVAGAGGGGRIGGAGGGGHRRSTLGEATVTVASCHGGRRGRVAPAAAAALQTSGSGRGVRPWQRPLRGGSGTATAAPPPPEGSAAAAARASPPPRPAVRTAGGVRLLPAARGAPRGASWAVTRRAARGGEGRGGGALAVWRRNVPALAVRHCRRRVLMAKRCAWRLTVTCGGRRRGGGCAAADVAGGVARGCPRGEAPAPDARGVRWLGCRRWSLVGLPGGTPPRQRLQEAVGRRREASDGGSSSSTSASPPASAAPRHRCRGLSPIRYRRRPLPAAARHGTRLSLPSPSGRVGVPRHPPRCPGGQPPAGVGRCGPPTASRRRRSAVRLQRSPTSCRRLAPARATRSPAPFGRPPPGANAPGFTPPTPPVDRRRGRVVPPPPSGPRPPPLTGDAVTYLCCVDPSLGFCAPVGVEHTRWGEVCTYNWRALDGGSQCCFRATDGRAEGALPGGVFGGTRPPPRLTVVCRRVFESCAPARAAAAAAAPPAASLPATGPVRVGVEVAGRCGSWDGATYTKCEVLECPTPGRAGRGKVRLTACQLWGTPAQCCMEHQEWWRRNKCCRKCRVPGRRPSSTRLVKTPLSGSFGLWPSHWVRFQMKKFYWLQRRLSAKAEYTALSVAE
ncbi:hypothetical protein BU14_0075s0042 [Porphyra umbilicalis]|uniref:Uncharacterized protein n=1 Tax=Porphyra umbilicalis TaxID=2786 RepID=A0A1X6PFB0_PORUM|nr:hypothetical protein BU14_0075s0042 [Porphyra umbilicalis]|eukprot:OSX79552.1 hypothetical protein BU14_0075s0042 [Porphyra umbilicalis]